jgi:hypothetical protein
MDKTDVTGIAHGHHHSGDRAVVTVAAGCLSHERMPRNAATAMPWPYAAFPAHDVRAVCALLYHPFPCYAYASVRTRSDSGVFTLRATARSVIGIRPRKSENEGKEMAKSAPYPDM